MSPPKAILVTGCSAGGIGAALSLALAQSGHVIFATARNPAKIPPELTGLLNVHALELDVTCPESIAAALAAVTKAGLGLDALVNNAGVGYTMPILDVDIREAKKLYETNLWGPLRLIQAFSDLLIQSRGRVVNVSSVGSVLNTPWFGTYASSKAALNIYSETLRVELEPFGVKVVTVMLGTVKSAFHDNEPAPRLPAHSRYGAILDIITEWSRGLRGPKRGPVRELVCSVVPSVLGGRDGLIWRGWNSTLVRTMSYLLPPSLLEVLLLNDLGLHELSKTVEAQAAMKVKLVD